MGASRGPNSRREKADCHQGYITGMTAPPFEYRYRAGNPRVIDGDTVDCCVDLGFRIQMRRRFRPLGINAPGKRRPTYEDGIAKIQQSGNAFCSSATPASVIPVP